MANPPLVIQLQHEALDPTVKVSDLVRRTKYVAAKLNLPDLMKWADAELQGYKENTPEYRHISGEVRAFNPFHGWRTIMFASSTQRDRLSYRNVGSSISELEGLLQENPDGSLSMRFSPEIEAHIRSAIEFDFEVALFIDRSKVIGILDSVRNGVLDWSLRLESSGIIGDGFSFSDKEKKLAHTPSISVSIGSIGSFSGNLGPVSDHATVIGSQTVTVDLEKLYSLVEQIEKALPAAGMSENNEGKSRELLSGVRHELSQPQLNQGRIKELFGFLKKVAEGAASKIVADGIVSNIDSIFPS